VLECTSIENLPSPDALAQQSRTPDAPRGALEGVVHEIRNRLTFVGRFARRLAKTIDPASREGTYVRVIMSETERLEQTLVGMGRKPR
jgi:nitrogen-specific signal transduction histidine kinase